jgi:ABC-type Fe3+-citrate transport system substrate-binding protein
VNFLTTYWPVITVIASAIGTSGIWLIAPRLKLKTLRARTKLESVNAIVAIDDVLQAKLKAMNDRIEQHERQIQELRLKNFDQELVNRSLKDELKRRDTTIAMLQEENEELRNQLP